jgi:hypothetical protein
MRSWLYAIVDEGPRRRLGAGLAGEPLRLVAARRGPLRAVVGEGTRTEWTRRALEGHARVVRRLARTFDALLPVRFGSTMAASRIATLLEEQSRALSHALRDVRGREQRTVRLYATGRATHRPAPPSGGTGTRYLAARRAAGTGREAALSRLRRAVGPLVRGERTTIHEEPPLVASVYHLIDRGRARDYRARLKKSGLDARASGPWAPWAFAPERWA